MFPVVVLLVCLGLLTFGVKADTDIEQLTKAAEDIQVEINGLKRRCSDSLPGGFIQEDDYLLAYTLIAGMGPRNDLLSSSECNDDELFIQSMRQCTCNSPRGPCNRHYRSSILDCWDRIQVSTVKVSVYKDGEEKQFAIFNATGIAYWGDTFRPWNLLESSWVDLNTATHDYYYYGEYFSNRYYYFNHVSGNCSTDAGWLIISNGPDNCPWATSENASYPLILYSPATTWVQYQSGVQKADALAVWFKFKNKDNLNAPCVQ